VGKQDIDTLIDRLADLIVKAERVVVFTGAGISTESGIPDFRSPGGIWERFDPEDFTYQRLMSSPETRKKWWQIFQERGLTTDAEPNPAHLALAELDKLGKLDCVITQNIDNLHQKAGMPDDKVFELHGNMSWIVCLSCGRRYPAEQIQARLDEGEEIPKCEDCHGILKPDIVLFGETLPEKVFEEATRRSSHADLFMVIGSTLIVYPAAYMPVYAVDSGAKLVIINLSSTPMGKQASVLIKAKAGETMSEVIQRVKEKLTRGLSA
jgi:NAD-dependent deacetylase